MDKEQETNIDVVEGDNETEPVNEPPIQTDQEEESAPTITITSGGGY